MALDRTWYDTLVNDDGSNGTGTVWNKAAVDSLMDAADAATVILPTTLTNHGAVIGQAGATLVATSAGTAGQVLTSNGASADPTFQAAAGGAFALLTSTSTGAQNNWAPGTGVVGNSLVEWSGASDAAITGLAGGATGRLVTIKNTGSANATFAHNSGSSSAGNKFKNIATSAATPIGPTGFITYQYDGTDWQLVAHEQGSPITPAYSAGNFTTNTGTWTVDAGDVLTYSYIVRGKTMILNLWIATTSVASSPVELRIAVPGGFTLSLGFQVPVQVVDASTGRLSQADSTAGLAYVRVYSQLSGAAWANATNTTYVIATLLLNVT